MYIPDSLTEFGQKQADALVDRMKCIKPDRVFASSSHRAVLTAQPTATALCKEIEILDWCNESYAYREFSIRCEDGRRRWCFSDSRMIRQMISPEIRHLNNEWYEHPDFVQTNFKEGIQRIRHESDALLSGLGYRHVCEEGYYIAERPNDDRIALFAHQGFGMAFLSCLLDIPYPQFCTHFDMGYTGVTAILFNGDDIVVPKVLQLSNDSHIFASGFETNYNGYCAF